MTEMNKIDKLLKQYHVDAYLCGHDHSLQHIFNKDTTQYHHFLCGTGSGNGQWGYNVRSLPLKTKYCANICGFLNVNVIDDIMKIEFISDKGIVLHSVDIVKQDRTTFNLKQGSDEVEDDEKCNNEVKKCRVNYFGAFQSVMGGGVDSDEDSMV